MELDRASNQTLNFSVLGERAEKIKAQIRQLETDAEIIHQHTSIRFDPEKGQYRTNLGVLTVQTIERVKRLLDQIVYAQGSRSRTTLIQAIEAYLRLIPLPIGMALNPEALLGTYAQVQHQRAVLQDLKNGLDLITQIRSEIQAAISNQRFDRAERPLRYLRSSAQWIRWGESETADIEISLIDTRLDCVF